MLVDGGTIAWVGRERDAPPCEQRVDLGGRLVSPGLIDAHAHPLYAEPRLAEAAAVSRGTPYADLVAAGDGMAATVRLTRAADRGTLTEVVAGRLRAWLDAGTTTVEAKTGYFFDRDLELQGLDLLAELTARPDLPDLGITFFAAHGPAVGADRVTDEYAAYVATWCKEAAGRGAHAVDAFCDDRLFGVDHARTVLLAARAAGLRTKVHADQFHNIGGARLAAEVGAVSADELNSVDEAGARALAAAGVTAVLCPVTALSIGIPVPVPLLRAAGVTLALGTDHNPGRCGLTDMTVVIGLAIASMGLSVDEALVAATQGGARSLGRDDVGVVAVGQRADLVAWDADHEGVFAWGWGVRPHAVWMDGNRIS